jgi:D-amino peptidase
MRRAQTILAGLLLVAGAGPVWAAARILIVSDMEGVGGVNNADEQLLPGQRRYDESRRLLAGELNAAVDGAFAAGASEVVIWDGHDGSRSLSVDDIDPRAKLIQGRPTPANYYLSDRAYDGIFFIGQHAMAGAKGGVLAHSQSFSVESITLNGRTVGEIGQVAAIAGYFHIPVVMLSGDQAASDEIRELQPNAETVAVKRLAGKASSLSLSHAEAKARIHAAAERAVAHISSYSPWIVPGPVEMIIRYYAKERAPAVYKGETVLEAYEAWLGK